MNEPFSSAAKRGRLLARWSKRWKDFRVDYPSNKSDAALLFWLFCSRRDEDGRTVIEDLERRGYDTKTLRFQIDKRRG